MQTHVWVERKVQGQAVNGGRPRALQILKPTPRMVQGEVSAPS